MGFAFNENVKVGGKGREKVGDDSMSTTLGNGDISPSSAREEEFMGRFPQEIEKPLGVVAPLTPPLLDEEEDAALVVIGLVQAQEKHHPMHWPAWKRWAIIIVYCSLQVSNLAHSICYSPHRSILILC